MEEFQITIRIRRESQLEVERRLPHATVERRQSQAHVEWKGGHHSEDEQAVALSARAHLDRVGVGGIAHMRHATEGAQRA